MRLLSLLAAVGAVLALSACNSEPDLAIQPFEPKQTDICMVDDLSDPSVLDKCKPGQKFAWLPSGMHNEQTPIVVATTLCDLRYEVVYGMGGVTCIYLKAEEKDSAVKVSDTQVKHQKSATVN